MAASANSPRQGLPADAISALAAVVAASVQLATFVVDVGSFDRQAIFMILWIVGGGAIAAIVWHHKIMRNVWLMVEVTLLLLFWLYSNQAEGKVWPPYDGGVVDRPVSYVRVRVFVDENVDGVWNPVAESTATGVMVALGRVFTPTSAQGSTGSIPVTRDEVLPVVVCGVSQTAMPTKKYEKASYPLDVSFGLNAGVLEDCMGRQKSSK